MGRSRKSVVRDKQLNLSLTEAELETIKRRAEAVGMRPVHFGRAIILDEHQAAATRQKNPESNGNRLIYGQLARVGNLLNQTVRHLHRTGDPLPPDLEPLLTDIRQIIARAPR